MTTFEQVYKSKFKEQLSKFIDKKIIVSNDINIKPFERETDIVVAIIKSGMGQASSRNELDLINTTFSINFIVNSNDLQNLLGALTSLIWNYNGTWDELEIPIHDIKNNQTLNKTYFFKPVFTTPIPFGDIGNVSSKTETITVASVVMNIALSYSSNVDVKPDNFKLKINNIYYNINASSYSMVYQPIYDPVSLKNINFAEQNQQLENVVFSFNLIKKIKGLDALQDLLTSNFLGVDPIAKKDLYLKRIVGTTEQETKIQTITFTEAFENGTKVIVLSITR